MKIEGNREIGGKKTQKEIEESEKEIEKIGKTEPQVRGGKNAQSLRGREGKKKKRKKKIKVACHIAKTGSSVISLFVYKMRAENVSPNGRARLLKKSALAVQYTVAH